MRRHTEQGGDWDETRVCKTGGNRSGSTDSRWNRSGLVHEPVRFPPNKPCLKFLNLNEPAGLTGLPAGFLNRGNR
jgi:hypothetical protein